MQNNGKITLAKRVIELTVDENGTTITIPVGDERFTKGLAHFIENVTKASDEMKNIDTDNIVEAADKDVEFHELLKKEFCTVFGEDTYEKLFGKDILVSIDFILDFLDQITPYVEEYNKERAKKIEKYSANRNGSTL